MEPPLFERLQVESQSSCNRTCWFCPRTYDQSGRYRDGKVKNATGHMTTELILDLLDQARDMGFRGRVGFHHYSEPLLDPRAVQLAREARDRGMKPYLHTNGDELRRSKELCGEVVETYSLIVIGVYDYRTDEELEKTKGYWLDRLQGANVEFSAIGLDGSLGARSMGVPRALVPSDGRMALPDLAYRGAPCHRPLLRMIIRHDGEMCGCCEDTLGAFRLGSVLNRTMEELWHSEEHIRMTEDLIAGRRERYRLCQNCPMSPTGPPPEGTELTIIPRNFEPQKV